MKLLYNLNLLRHDKETTCAHNFYAKTKKFSIIYDNSHGNILIVYEVLAMLVVLGAECSVYTVHRHQRDMSCLGMIIQDEL